MRHPLRPFSRQLVFVAAVLGGAGALPGQAQDVATLGTVTAAGGAAVVPLYVRDVSGSPLGVDQASGNRIQGLSFRVSYSPAGSVSSVTFSRAGITASLTPLFELSPSSGNTISYIGSFNETTYLIPFVSNAAAPGNQVLQLNFTLSGSATPGTVITLTIDPSNTVTALSNQAGSVTETTTNGNLSLVNGSITIPEAAPVVSAIDPSSGPATGGTPVAISGANFQNGATLTIGGVAASGGTVNGPSSISATTGAHTAGVANVVVTNPDAQSGTLTNGFTYTSIGPGNADLTVSKSDSPDPATVGGSITYTVAVANNGPDAATGVVLSDTLPAELSYVTASATQGSLSLAGSTVTWTIGALANGGSATATIVTTPTAPGQVANSVTVAGTQNDPNVTNNAATATTTVIGGSTADLTATWSKMKKKGSSVSTRLRLRNIGISAAGAFKAKVYHSNDGAVGSGDRLIKTLSMTGLEAGASGKPVKIKYSSKKPIGGHYLIAVADSDNIVGEDNEANNTVAARIP